ncbi:MAG: energy-coupling factor ABC transporter permease [Candidatus Freyrarchaeum guaymaensis]
MAHIHLPDGIIPLEWVVVWFALTAALLVLGVYIIGRKGTSQRQIILLALLTGLIFVIMQIPIPSPLGGTHFSFTPLAGILVGPWFGAILVFLLNVFCAAVGHGGVTVIGANTVVLFVEVSLAYALYRVLQRYIKRRDIPAGIATFTALVTSTIVAVGIITLSGGFQSFQTAFIEFMRNPLIPVPHFLPHELEPLEELLLGELYEQFFGPIVQINIYYAFFRALTASANSFAAFLAAMLPVNTVIGAVEAVITGIIVETLGRVRPDILGGQVMVEENVYE